MLRESDGPWAMIAGESEGLGSAFATAAATREPKTATMARWDTALASMASERQRDQDIETRTRVQVMYASAQPNRRTES